jgi:hypothetical protein
LRNSAEENGRTRMITAIPSPLVDRDTMIGAIRRPQTVHKKGGSTGSFR